MEMKLQFPADAPQVLSEIKVSEGVTLSQAVDGEYTITMSSDTIITFTLHTPDGAFTYTIDNAAKTLTTESDSTFLA